MNKHRVSILTEYLEKLKECALDYAQRRSEEYDRRYKKKVFNSTYRKYYSIGMFLYLRTGPHTMDMKDFNFNRIHSSLLKKFSCKLYHKIILDLEKNQLIRINNHYNYIRKRHGQKQKTFSKSYLLPHSAISGIKNELQKFKKSRTTVAEFPLEIERVLNGYLHLEEDVPQRKLNTNLIESSERIEIPEQTVIDTISKKYCELTVDEDSFAEEFKNDWFGHQYWRRRLERLKTPASFKDGRFYHEFHLLSKRLRELLLRHDGKKLKEIFDIRGADLHMLAKAAEKFAPAKEMLAFQKDVISDFRKRFGVRKRDGRCTAKVKQAFKVYLNSKRDFYDLIRYGSICWKIDEYFKEKYPTIREYIISHNDIWKTSMKEEFEVVSCKMSKELARRGIASFSCHDALYVHEDEKVDDINELFYDCLGLSCTYQAKFDCI